MSKQVVKPVATVSANGPVLKPFYRVVQKSTYEWALEQVDVDPSASRVVGTPDIKSIVLDRFKKINEGNAE